MNNEHPDSSKNLNDNDVTPSTSVKKINPVSVFFDKYKFLINKKNIGTYLFLALLTGTVIFGVDAVGKQQLINQKAQGIETGDVKFDNSATAISAQKIKKSESVLEVEFNYNVNNSATPLTIVNVLKRNGYPQTAKFSQTDYKIVIKAGQNVLYSAPIQIPSNEFIDDFTEDTTDEIVDNSKTIKVPETNFTVSYPDNKKADQISVVSKDGRILSTYMLAKAKSTQNKPDFYIISGSDYLERKQKNKKINSLFPLVKKVSAQNVSPTPSANTPKPSAIATPSIPPPTTLPASPEYLNIVFIGDNYTQNQLAQFHTNVNQAIDELANTEPFKSRFSQLRFAYIDNLEDLGCNGFPPICDMAKVSFIVNASGVPYDKVHIFTFSAINQVVGGGLSWRGGTFSISNATIPSPGVFVHELGHSLGNLYDEYQTTNLLGYEDNNMDINCLRGSVKPTELAEIAGKHDLFNNCTYPNWYRTGTPNVMADGLGMFNIVSRKYLNLAIDNYAGPFLYTDATPPQVSFNYPTDNMTANGIVDVKINTTDNVRTEIVQLLVDGELFHTDVTPLFNSTYIGVRSDLINEGDHTLQLRAYDAAGNMSYSNIITVHFAPEIIPTPGPTPIQNANLINNPNFERDSDGDNKPDSWTPNKFTTRSSDFSHDNKYSIKHSSSSGSSYGVSQKIENLEENISYRFRGWTNIPATSDVFTYKLVIVWQNSDGKSIRTDTAKSYSAGTKGWDEAYKTMISPKGTKSAVVRMVVKNLNTKIYSDDFSFKKVLQ